LFRRALEISREFYGEEHPRTAVSIGALASFLVKMNRLSEAEPLMRQALAIDEANGRDPSTLANRLNSLVVLLCESNRLSEAEPLARRALAIDEAFYGKDNPSLGSKLNNLAQILLDTNSCKRGRIAPAARFDDHGGKQRLGSSTCCQGPE